MLKKTIVLRMENMALYGNLNVRGHLKTTLMLLEELLGSAPNVAAVKVQDNRVAMF